MRSGARIRNTPALQGACASIALASVAIAGNSACAQALGDAPAVERASHLVLGAAVEHTDNVLAAETIRTADTIIGAVTEFNLYAPRSRRIEAAIEGSFAYYKYDQSSYLDEIIGGASAGATATIIPDRLAWTLQDSYGQVRINQLAAVSALNREDYNLLETGPRLTFLLGKGRTSLQIDARYERVDYEIAATDNQSTLLQVQAVRQASARQQFGLLAASRSTKFDATSVSITDYDRHQLAANWRLRGARTEFRIEGGYSIVDDGNSTANPLVRVNFSRELSRRMTLSAQARSEVVGAGDALRFDQSASGIGRRTAEVATTSEPFTYREAGFSLVYEGSRYRSAFDVSKGSDRYSIGNRDDRDREFARLRFDARVSPRWTIGSTIDYRKEGFPNLLDTDSESKSAWLNATCMLGDAVQLSGEVGYRMRDSTYANGSYDEAVARLRVSYGFGRGYRPTELRNALPER